MPVNKAKNIWRYLAKWILSIRSQDNPTYSAQSGDKHGLESSSIPDARRWMNAVAIFENNNNNVKQDFPVLKGRPTYDDSWTKVFGKAVWPMIMKKDLKDSERTNSNMGLGTFSQLDRFARTGNKAPDVEPTSIMNTEAILRPKDESSPPPEPHSTAADITGTQLADIWGESGDSLFSHFLY